jgi:hypothetical protein
MLSFHGLLIPLLLLLPTVLSAWFAAGTTASSNNCLVTGSVTSAAALSRFQRLV